MTDDLPPLAAALKAYRTSRGLTQEQLAAERGMTVATIRQMELAGRSPTSASAMLASWAISELVDRAP